MAMDSVAQPLLEISSMSVSSNVQNQRPLGFATSASWLRLCSSSEGWGPLNPGGDDMTPCFQNLLILMVSLFGIVLGTPACCRLSRIKSREQVRRGWQWWIELTICASILVFTVAQTIICFQFHPYDIRLWSSSALAASVLIFGSVRLLETSARKSHSKITAGYWIILFLVLGAKLYSFIARGVYRRDKLSFTLFSVTLVLVAVEFIIVWIMPPKGALQVSQAYGNQCPSQQASIVSILTFDWMTPMMRHGYKQYITEHDLWDLPKQDNATTSASALETTWHREKVTKVKPSLWLALFRAFGPSYAGGVALKAVADLLAILQPQLLRYLLLFIDSYQESPSRSLVPGVVIAFSMFSVSVAQSLCLHQCFQSFSQTGIKLKASIISAIYRKSLRLSNEARGTRSTGDIVNLMAVDSQRIQDVTQFSQHLWSAPLQIILCMLLLYKLLGYSMFAGVVVIIMTIPVNGHITTGMKKLQKQQMKNKDTRSKLITEVVANIKSIKLLAWDAAFATRIRHIRNDQELLTMRKMGALHTLSSFISSIAPFMVACSTFAVRVLVQQRPLTTDIVFPAIALFQLLTSPMVILPATISSVTEATVAANRLSTFLTADELQLDAVTREEATENAVEESVSIRKATFTWSMHGTKNVLEDISLSARMGELCCVIGQVGAGKSSLLHALLGDLHKVNGDVTLRGSVAYVSQQPWVLNTSIKENITFGKTWDPELYEETLSCCALPDDLAQLPHGDQTLVGDQGIILSGGQKARLTLARAVYARADVYLLDDCLSAVDQHVGRHLIEHVLGPRGVLKDKVRIFATHSTPVLREADAIVMIRNGKIIEQGTYQELSTAGTEFGSLTGLTRHNDMEQTGELPTLSASSGNNNRTGQVSAPAKGVRSSKYAGRGSGLVDIEAVAGTPKPRKELTQQGSVKWKVYDEYAKASSLIGILIYAVAMIGAQVAEIGGNLLLKQWSEASDDPRTSPDVKKYLGIYVGFGLGSALLVVLQSWMLWLWCSIRASRRLHESMILALLRSPMSFFEMTPAGQILNRFSSDIYRIDQSLPRQFSTLFINTIKALFSLIVISSGNPAFIVLAIPLVLVYCYMQRYYLGAKRELKRLDGVSRSPVFAHFKETLGGLTTIRAFLQQDRFIDKTEGHLDANMKAYTPSITANRWLGVRLEFIGSIIILAAASLSLVSPALGIPLSAGMAGIMISYALQITQSFSSLVRATGEVETNIVSAERVLEYTHLPSEAADIISDHRPPVQWPIGGSIRFSNYSTRYRSEQGNVLRNINLDFKPGEKIGVVGRTGAGKSSMALSLFRIVEPTEGSIHIDDINISDVGLLDLRQRLTIIPQDPALFEGTIRENLDPSQAHDDTELWDALEGARLKQHVAGMAGGLDSKIYEGGTNLSQGQRQLVSLARAMLKPSNVLVLDEATAAVDVETDTLVQETLQESIYGNRTVVTIAHRMSTVLDSDRIVVLDKGEVVEFDAPAALIARKGVFYELIREAGLLGKFQCQIAG